MATEICASRLLAPYFGSSTIVWANIIGLVLAALAVGYWLGGRLADRRPSRALLGGLVAGAACFVAAIPFVARPFLDASTGALDRVDAGAAIGSFFGALLLFAPPVVLLGAVAPFAIRLAIVDLAPEALARAVVEDCRGFAGGELPDDCAVVAIKRV